MTRTEKINLLKKTLLDEVNDVNSNIERIQEKTDEQLDYILSPIDQCIYLEACAGSGKTEVLGIKTAFEFQRWNSNNSGIAVLTFTNEATSTIKERVSAFYKNPVSSKHFIGTFSSFVHGHIAQRFGYKFYDSQNRNDKSFTIIDSNAQSYNNQWLSSFRLKVTVKSSPGLRRGEESATISQNAQFLP